MVGIGGGFFGSCWSFVLADCLAEDDGVVGRDRDWVWVGVFDRCGRSAVGVGRSSSTTGVVGVDAELDVVRRLEVELIEFPLVLGGPSVR